MEQNAESSRASRLHWSPFLVVPWHWATLHLLQKHLYTLYYGGMGHVVQLGAYRYGFSVARCCDT